MPSNEWRRQWGALVERRFRYGQVYDEQVDQYICPSLVKTKRGQIAKRQPKIQHKDEKYWKAQCFFRGLDTSGGTLQLRERLANRDRTKDVQFDIEHQRICDSMNDLDETYESEDPPEEVAEQERLWAEQDRIRQARNDAATAAKSRERKAKHKDLLSEAMQMPDWDITGSWKVHCDEIAKYMTGDSVELTMEIFRDDFAVDDSGRPEEEPGSDESEDEYLEEEERAIEREEATRRKKAAQARSMAQSHIPKFRADFEFSIVEGTMRLFPPAEVRKSKNTFRIRTNPTFEYVWRGRETGEGEIQNSADENVFQITFGDFGTTFEGRFQCEFLEAVTITGTKLSHGRGQSKLSKKAWRNLSERQWDRECTGRWGKWR